MRPAGPAPRAPRRISGPVQGRAGAAPGRRIAAPPRPRKAAPARPRRASAAPAPALPRRAAAFLAALPDHRWLDRIVRGRAWIPVIGVLLVGIVAMQVEVLKLGASIGRSMTLATQLQSRNQLLRASVAQLSDDQRIERAAARMGMVMPGPTEVRFDAAGGKRALSRALSGISAPAPATFLTSLQAERSAVSGASVATALAAQAASSAATAATAGSATSGTGASVAPVTPTITPATTASAGTAGSGASPTTPGSTAASTGAVSTSGSAPVTGTTSSAGAGAGATTVAAGSGSSSGGSSGGVSVPSGG